MKQIIFLVIGMLVLGACGGDDSKEGNGGDTLSLSKGLVTYYKFDGNTKDSSGQGNDGEEHGDVTYVDGVKGKAINFDGIDDYIRIANKNPNSLKEFTISLYLLPTGNGGSIFNSYSWNTSIGRGFALTLSDEIGSGVPEGTGKDFLWFGSLSDEGWFENQSKWIKTKLDRYKFLHVCAVYKNGKERLYINGKLKAFHTVEHKFDLGNYDFFIGTYLFNNATNNVVDAYGRAFKGQMDELRFYNRALDETEVKGLYNLGLGDNLSPQKNEQLLYTQITDSFYFHKVTLQGKNDSCSVDFAIAYVEPYQTDCIANSDENGVINFCLADKSMCRTFAEVSYFKVTKKDLYLKKPTDIPFVGGGDFNFLGGSGTRESAKISSDKRVVYQLYGVESSGISWQGLYLDSNNPYWIEDNVVCKYNKKGKLSICTEFNRAY